MKRNLWLTLSAVSFAAFPVLAQTPPNAGTLLEQPRQLPTLPSPGGAPAVVLPPAPAAAPYDASVRVTPTAFRIEGNTLFSDAQLQAVVAPYLDKSTDMGGLLEAAAAIRRFYRDRGYLLTEAYLPQQQFSASGGTVTIQVLEARIGQVRVRVDGSGISQSLPEQIVRTHLHPGDYISEYTLEKPILLLRDLPGYDATASVEPGSNVGEADILVVVKPYGNRFDGSVGLDNFGVRSAGEWRAFVDVNANNLTGRGDLLSARLQTANESGSNLYRIGYSMPVGGYATKIGLSATRNEYALGHQFAALGATGVADVFGLSVTHPFIRSRAKNFLGAVTLERKNLRDETDTPQTERDGRVSLIRLSALGNFVDNVGTGSFNSYALSFAHGKAELDANAAQIDQGPAGLNTSGTFSKANLEFVRTMYLNSASRFIATAQAQWASKNLVSAEKFTIGGVAGVRGYPAGEGVGDSGAILNLEYQHLLPDFGSGVPLNASVFYDVGWIRYNMHNTLNLDPNDETLSSLGFGLTAGTYGRWLLSAQLAWRLDRAPSTGDPDKKPRIWFSAQKWF
jgi:hemolysin activation/secretion protein